MNSKQQLIAELEKKYEQSQYGEKKTVIHLFGIEHADALSAHKPEDIAEEATGKRSYGTELRTGMRLAKYVTLKAGV